ncbi:MAG: serine/threonine protein kinase [Acidobacteria bacterium]|nr:serine/threonine protein kinase [Acidobacteriota bacterium]
MRDRSQSRSQIYLRPGQTVTADSLELENLELLGRGGNGTVFRMIIKSGVLKGLIVAVKFLDTLGDQERIDRFDQEIKVLQEVNHPHVIKVLDRGKFSGREQKSIPFFVMEYQPRNLQRELDAHPRGLHPDSVLPVCLQMASALVYLHSKDIIHRDLKPANLLFDGTNIKLADFGLASLVERSGLRIINTPDGEKLAPHFYMSPEQWNFWKQKAEESPGKSSDVFQIGLVMYEMMTGFNINTVPQWERAETKGQPKEAPIDQARNLDGSLVNDVIGIVREMVALDPSRRPAAEEVQERLLVAFQSYSSHFSALYGVRPGREF